MGGDIHAAEETSRTDLLRRSAKNYDDLIREYIRGARERLEAARQRSPLVSQTSFPHLPSSDTQQSSAPSHYGHTASTAGALPSPSVQWPLPEHTRTQHLGLQPGDKATEPPREPYAPLTTLESSTAINFNARPVQVLAAAAPELAPQTQPNSPLQSIHRRTPSSLRHTRAPSVPTIREGHASHVLTPSKASAMFLRRPSGDSQLDRSQDDHELNPFRDDGERGLVREASVGRSHRPILTEIVSRSSQEQRRSTDQARHPGTPRAPHASLQHTRVGVAAPDTTIRAPLESKVASDGLAFRSGTALLTPTASIISEVTNKTGFVSSSAPTLPTRPEIDGLHRPGTTESLQSSAPSFRFGNLPVKNGQSSLGERVGSRKPARLNLDAVKEAENRGSLTSLPDLIQRALRLASNLERERPADRLGNDSLEEKTAGKFAKSKRRASLTSASASLPSLPMAGSQVGDRNKGVWPQSAGLRSNLRRSYLPSLSNSVRDPEKTRSRAHRRCCGMPLRLFALIIALVFVLIVAAILVPIFIIVIPQQAKAGLSCANGGVGVTSATGAQQCICVDGYTGTSCERADEGGCTSISLSNVENATVGAMLPAVLANAAADYAINLNTSILLPLFSTMNMTCESETSLVSFRGVSSRSVSKYKPQLSNHRNSGSTTVVDAASITAAPKPLELFPRQPQAMTQNGIVFAQSSVAISSSTSTSATAAVPSATSTGSPNFSPTSDHTLGFARTAVLYIFQNSQELLEAQTAHSELYLFLTNPNVGDPTDVQLGGGWSVNLEAGTVSNGEGASVGM